MNNHYISNDVSIKTIYFLFITYNRSDLLEKSFFSLRNAVLKIGLQAIYIASDDASNKEHQGKIDKMGFDLVISAASNSGLGANQNQGLAACKSGYIFQVQDDWIFTGNPSDLLQAINIVESDKRIGILQLTNVMSDLPVEQRKLNSNGFRVFRNDGLPWYRNCSVRPYSDNPHLKRIEFVSDLGQYLEGVPMTVSENDFKKRVALQNKWKVAQMDSCIFEHLGKEVSLNEGGKRHPVINMIKSIPLLGKEIEVFIRKVYVFADHKAALFVSTLRGD